MTTRTKIALWIIGAGLAIAALAGVPMIASSVAGVVLWYSGLAASLGGGVVAATAVPGQRVANKRLKEARAWDTHSLLLECARLLRKHLRAVEAMKAARAEAMEAKRGPAHIDAHNRMWAAIDEMDDLASLATANAYAYFRLTGKPPGDLLPLNEPPTEAGASQE